MAFNDYKLLQQAFGLDAEKTYQLWLKDIGSNSPKLIKDQAYFVMAEFQRYEEKLRHQIRAKLAIHALDQTLDQTLDEKRLKKRLMKDSIFYKKR